MTTSGSQAETEDWAWLEELLARVEQAASVADPLKREILYGQVVTEAKEHGANSRELRNAFESFVEMAQKERREGVARQRMENAWREIAEMQVLPAPLLVAELPAGFRVEPFRLVFTADPGVADSAVEVSDPVLPFGVDFVSYRVGVLVRDMFTAARVVEFDMRQNAKAFARSARAAGVAVRDDNLLDRYLRECLRAWAPALRNVAAAEDADLVVRILRSIREFVADHRAEFLPRDPLPKKPVLGLVRQGEVFLRPATFSAACEVEGVHPRRAADALARAGVLRPGADGDVRPPCRIGDGTVMRAYRIVVDVDAGDEGTRKDGAPCPESG